MDGLILEPLKFYNSVARQKHENLAQEHFDSLIARSGVNVEENKRTVAAYDAVQLQLNELKKRIQNRKNLYGLLIALAIIGIVLFVIGIYVIIDGNTGRGVLLLSIGSVAAVVGFVVAFVTLRPRIKAAELQKSKLMAESQKLYEQAKGQMASLNALYDDTDTLKIIEKTIPQLKFDRAYSNEREDELREDFDYVSFTGNETSIVNTLSGTMFGNPFIFERYLVHQMGTCAYHGTLTIMWTEHYRDKDGHLRTRTRTQVLTASVVKPKPYYSVKTHLGFGSVAAPDLTFTRGESDTDELSEREMQRKIRKGEKKLQKKARDALKKGESFQEMTNSEFDVLFDATDRDHEVQFRLMYTPLAQKNTLDLLRSKDGYGDDFNFYKLKRYNIIKSVHAQNWDMDISTSRYVTHSVELSRKKFLDFNATFFKSIFFDFAPLIAVPAYQDEPTYSLKDPKPYKSYYPSYEHESLANMIGDCVFAHERSGTCAILKTSILEQNNGVDRVAVTAYSYATENRVDLVPVLGGDGNIHSVPVHWIEYIPIRKQSDMLVKALNHTSREFADKSGGSMPQNGAYFHGMLAYAPTAKQAWEQINQTFEKYI